MFEEEKQPLALTIRRAGIFSGALLVARQAPAMLDLIAHAGHMLTNGLAPATPVKAHEAFDADELMARIRAVRAGFRQDTGIRGLVETLAGQLGGDRDDAYFDSLNLRIAPPAANLPRPACPLPPHRDSWASNLYQQINIWAPIAPLSAKRTMVLYPDCWNRAVANDSAAWNLDELRRLAREGGRADYPDLPTAMDGQALGVPASVLIEPGDVLLFSGTHLHASLMDDPSETRLSFDTRLVFARDASDGAAAPNVDGEALLTAWRWFKRLSDGAALEPPGPRAR